VRTCVPCQCSLNAPPRRIVSPWPPAQAPREHVHLDYLGPFEGHYLLFGVDASSGWPIIKNVPVPNLTADVLIAQMRYVFAEYGKPPVIASYDGRQFSSAEIGKFLRRNGVKLLFTPPWHPSSNGIIERTGPTFKRFFPKSSRMETYMRDWLQSFGL